MNKSSIEWVQNPDGSPGYTWNPITGCLNHVNGLCKGGNFPCYAYRLANGRLKQMHLENPKLAPRNNEEDGSYNLYEDLHDPFYPRFWPERLHQPESIKRPSGILMCDMGELFGYWVPREWQEQVFEVIRACPQHRFYLLTKQPQNLVQFSPFPANCWVGVTATNEAALWHAMRCLKEIQASICFISFEPLLGAMPNDAAWPLLDSLKQCDIRWAIIGAQTNPYKAPRVEWLREAMKAADKAGVAVFLENNLKAIWPGPLRQEMPEEGKNVQ